MNDRIRISAAYNYFAKQNGFDFSGWEVNGDIDLGRVDGRDGDALVGDEVAVLGLSLGVDLVVLEFHRHFERGEGGEVQGGAGFRDGGGVDQVGGGGCGVDLHAALFAHDAGGVGAGAGFACDGGEADFGA